MRKGPRTRRGLAQVMLPLASLTALVVGGARWRLRLVTVTGASMEPSLRVGDKLVIVRCRGVAVRRGDVVLAVLPPAAYTATVTGSSDEVDSSPSVDAERELDMRYGQSDNSPRDDSSHLFVKRVVALPGDWLTKADVLAMLAPGRPGADNVPEGALIPPNSCYLVGDGTESADSVGWGPLPLSLVIGRAVAHRGASGTSGWSRVPGSPWRE